MLTPSSCSDAQPCQLAGRYVLGPGTVAPGLELTIPAGGWTANHAGPNEVNLLPPGAPPDSSERVGLWANPIAVQPDGPDVGAVRTDIGTRAHDLVRWFESEPAFATTRPRPVVVGHTFPAKSLDLTASTSAHSPDPECGSAHCVNAFSTAGWGPGGIGIGGDETLRLNIGTVRTDAGRRTFIVGLEGENAQELAALQREAQPILDSIRTPRPGHRRGPSSGAGDEVAGRA